MSVKISENQHKEWSKMYGTSNRPVKHLRDYLDKPDTLNYQIGLLSGVIQDARCKRQSPALNSLLKASVYETLFNSCGCNPDMPYIEFWLSKQPDKKGLLGKFFGGKKPEVEQTAMSDDLKPSIPDEKAIAGAGEVLSLLNEKDFDGTDLCLSIGQTYLSDFDNSRRKAMILDFGFYFNKKIPLLKDYPNPQAHAKAMLEYEAQSEKFFKLIKDIITRPARQKEENIQPTALGQNLSKVVLSLPNNETSLDYINLYFTNTAESTIVAKSSSDGHKINFDGFTVDDLANFPNIILDIQLLRRRHINNLTQVSK